MYNNCHNGSDFDVIVLGNNATEFCNNGARYVALNEGEFKLRLINNSESRADAVVAIDGSEVGVWRVNAFSSITIERPANVNRAFNFVSESSNIARRTGNIIGAESNGLVVVKFKPELKIYRTYSPRLIRTGNQSELENLRPRSPRLMSSQNIFTNSRSIIPPSYNQMLNSLSSGVTVLGDQTSQEFYVTDRIERYDLNRQTKIQIRLVVKDGKPDYINIKYAQTSKYPKRLDYYGDDY